MYWSGSINILLMTPQYIADDIPMQLRFKNYDVSTWNLIR